MRTLFTTMNRENKTFKKSTVAPEPSPTPANTPTESYICPLKVAKWAHAGGLVEQEQVDAMEKFTKGEMDYGTMRSMCG